MAADHKSILGRSDNIVFVRFARIAEPRYAAISEVHTCRSCAHWSEEDGGAGRCLADCGARATPPQGRCGAWRRPPLLTVV